MLSCVCSDLSTVNIYTFVPKSLIIILGVFSSITLLTQFKIVSFLHPGVLIPRATREAKTVHSKSV